MQTVFNAKSPAPLNETDMMFYRVLKKGDVYRESSESTPRLFWLFYFINPCFFSREDDARPGSWKD